MNIKRVKWSYLNIKKQKLEYRAELQRIKDSREVIPDPMRSEESMKLIEDLSSTYKCNFFFFGRTIKAKIANFIHSE